MSQVYDVVVLGLGANGSSALYQLSGSTNKILGIDRFVPPHTFGSSHGESRIIRQAYYENPLYVPFVKEAYMLWQHMEELSQRKLFLKTGNIMLGSRKASVIRGSMKSAALHGIHYEFYEPKDLKKRFPAFLPSDDTVGVLEKEAGILFPEECIKTFIAEAQKKGAAVHCDETVLSITPNNSSVEIITDKSSYSAGTIIVAAGAWTGGLLPELKLPLTVERQVLYWFKNRDSVRQQFFQPQNMPVFIWEPEQGLMFYGFPDLGTGVKIANHHAGQVIEPGKMKQDVRPDEIYTITEVISKHLNMNAEFNNASVCMYTNTPDENFIIDYYPGFKNVIIASPCSGHGFKFSSVTGKLLSEMATGKPLQLDISPFSLGRF